MWITSELQVSFEGEMKWPISARDIHIQLQAAHLGQFVRKLLKPNVLLLSFKNVRWLLVAGQSHTILQ